MARKHISVRVLTGGKLIGATLKPIEKARRLLLGKR